MLKKLIVDDFQRHEYFKLDFDPGVTCLVGPTDSGKSAVFRALRWLILNKPSGDAFVRRGSEGASVRLLIDDHEIVRERIGGENAYALDGRRFHAFGQGVPDEIASLLNVDDVNFARQFDPPFLFSQSAAEVARFLNRVVSLDLIDSTLSNLAKGLHRAKEAVRVGKERLKAARERRDALAWVEDADAELKEVEELEAGAERVSLEMGCLATLLEEVDRLHGVLDDGEAAIMDMEEAVVVGRKAIDVQREVSSLEGLLEEVATCKEQAKQAKAEASRIEGRIKESSQGRCPICGNQLTVP